MTEENQSQRSHCSLSNLGPKAGETKARLTIRLDHIGKKVTMWDGMEQSIEFDFKDAPYVISSITDPETPRDREYHKKMIKP